LIAEQAIETERSDLWRNAEISIFHVTFSLAEDRSGFSSMTNGKREMEEGKSKAVELVRW